ncbi:MAG: PTS sugar transporter subunit IIB [Holdemanella porci]
MIKLVRVDHRLLHGQVIFSLDKTNVSKLYYCGR